MDWEVGNGTLTFICRLGGSPELKLRLPSTSQPSLTAFRVFRVTENDFKSNVFLLVVCFVPATRLSVRSGLGRPEAVWFIKTCSYSISYPKPNPIPFILNCDYNTKCRETVLHLTFHSDG